MTKEEKTAYLERYLHCEANTEHLLAELQRWSAIATSATMVLSHAPARRTGPGGSKTERTVEHIVLLQNTLFEQVDTLACLYRETSAVIDALPQGPWRMVLRYRYLGGLPWEQTAQKTGYCTRQLRRLHTQALQALRLPEEAPGVLPQKPRQAG